MIFQNFCQHAIALLLASTVQAALPHITIKGSKFYTTSGDQFFLKGIAYQLDPLDTLQNTTQCQLDAALMKKVGANSIRVYHVKEPVDHSGCMKAFEDEGIYVFVDLDSFHSDIDQYDPMWTKPQMKSFEAVMDEFQKYDNTAGFFIGNEVLTEPTQSEVAPFIKSSLRSMKEYRDNKGYRKIPIGYSHADIADLRPHLQNYLACGDDSLASVDFFGLNNYEWCGPNTYVGSNYANLTQQIMHYPKPIFLSETGCITDPPRTFQDQKAVFGPEMSPYWSGAIVYEWIQESNHYGLVAYNPDATDALVTTGTQYARKGTPLPISPDFSNLMSVWATAKASSTPEAAYTPKLTPPACPEYTKNLWEVAGNVVLPTLGETLNKAVQFSITAGHPKGKPHQTTPVGAQSSDNNNGAAPGLVSPPPFFTALTQLLSRSPSSGDKQFLKLSLGLVGTVLGLAIYL